MAKTEAGERWLLKLGMDKSQGRKATASILTKSLAARGVATDAIKEVVAAEAFKVLPARRALESIRVRMTAQNPFHVHLFPLILQSPFARHCRAGFSVSLRSDCRSTAL